MSAYCYVGQREIFPQGFANRGLPLERARRVLGRLRRECLFLLFQGGESLLYPGLGELARHAKAARLLARRLRARPRRCSMAAMPHQRP